MSAGKATPRTESNVKRAERIADAVERLTRDRAALLAALLAMVARCECGNGTPDLDVHLANDPCALCIEARAAIKAAEEES